MKTGDDGNGGTTADKLGRGGDQRYGEIYPERITRDDKENPENPQSTPYDPPW
jgi:hypothetical protein